MIYPRIIPPDDVKIIWDEIAAWVENALGIDKSYTVNDVKTACMRGELTLWVIYEDEIATGFLTTVINDCPQGRTCYAPWLGGENLSGWVAPAFGHLKQYLKGKGVMSYSWIGRKAWQKLIKVDSEQVFYFVNLT